MSAGPEAGKMLNSKLLPLIVATILLTGCESIVPMNVARYSSNPLVQQVLLEHPGLSVSVGHFSMGPSIGEKLECLIEDIALPDGATISEYIRSSLIAELGAAGHYSPNAQVSISGTVEMAELEYTRRVMLGAHGGTWRLQVSLVSTNGSSISVEAVHSYNTGWAPIRCNIAADYLMPAVQTLVSETVRHSGFFELY
jgi:hypothetical protein